MGWVVFFAIFGLAAGFLTAGLFLAFFSVSTGFSEIGSLAFWLLGTLCSLGFFAWGMSIRERFRMMSNRGGKMGAFRARIEAEKKLAEDPFYEPSPLGPLRGRKKPVIDPSWGVPVGSDGDATRNEEGPA